VNTRDAHLAYLRAERFAGLDGLRCLAILPVVWHHATLGPRPGILGRGPLGVDLFFAISGFLITTLLLRETSRNGGVSIRDFYARRALRIFPIYYTVLALYVLHAWCWMQAGPQRSHFFQSVPSYATYTSNWFVDYAVPHPVSFAFAWSLAAEEQFYLVWPWVVGGRRALRWGAPVLVALLLLALQAGVSRGLWTSLLLPGGLARRIAGSIAAPICMGAVLAVWLHSRRGFALARVALGRSWSAAVVFCLVIACASVDGVPLWLARVILTLLVGACAIRARHWLSHLLDSVPVRWVGTVSYGMYLFHVPVIAWSRRVLPSAFGGAAPVFVFALPITIVLASASFVWFERPLLRLRPKGASRAQKDDGPELSPEAMSVTQRAGF